MTLPTPTTDLAEVCESLGQAWGVTCGEPVLQYLAWCDRVGMFRFLGDASDAATVHEVVAATGLSERGADALLCVASALGVVTVDDRRRYALSPLGREYFLAASPYYAGQGMYVGVQKDLPSAYLRAGGAGCGDDPPVRWEDAFRLRVQHSRNFAATVVATRLGRFDGVSHVVDVAGGSGVCVIPLALDRPDIRLTMIELPRALPGARAMLAEHGVADRVTLVAMDIFDDSQEFPSCDAVFFGNVFHAVSDSRCRYLATKAFRCLAPGGRVLLHEVLFDERRDGPLLAALWHANMIIRSDGAAQRTASELDAILRDAGFAPSTVATTASRFSLLAARKEC